jgi:putative flippase GtrA
MYLSEILLLLFQTKLKIDSFVVIPYFIVKDNRLTANQHLKDLITFFLVAVAGASVNFSVRIVYGLFMNFEWSVIIAYLTAMSVGFILTKRFAFNAKSSGNTYREMIKFILVSLLALVSTLLASVTALKMLNFQLPDRSLFFRETSAHVVGMGFSFLTNFFGHKLFTFKTTGFYDRFHGLIRQRL